jgi:nucleotide-binding universal stress UspA family protein
VLYRPGWNIMDTVDRILVATSFSERSADAVRKAAVLAAQRHTSLTLLHVVEPVKNRRLRRLVKQEMLV